MAPEKSSGEVEFDASERERIAEIVARYPNAAAALLPVLHLAQDKFSHLDSAVQLLVARCLDIAPSRVREVVTFYEMYHEHQEGQFHLEVCTNIACHLLGGDAILEHISARLDIRPGHVSSDGVFSLMEAECLASCGSGVCMKVGLDYYEQLTLPAVDALLERFKNLAPKLNGASYRHAEPEPHVGPVKGFEPPREGTGHDGSPSADEAQGCDASTPHRALPRESVPASADESPATPSKESA